jgi:hypothetical protein
MNKHPEYYKLSNQLTGDVKYDGITIDEFNRRGFRTRYLGSKKMPKINLKELAKLQMSSSSFTLLLNLIKNASSENRVRDGQEKYVPATYSEIARGYVMKYSTVARHFKYFKSVDLLRVYDECYYLHPKYVAKFSFEKIPTKLESAYPEMFREDMHYNKYD